MSELVKLAKEALRQQKALKPILTIQPGDRITWQRADLSIQQGVVDYLHADDDGQQWAFVSLGETWTAVNTKAVRVMTP